jgi:peptidoglycan/xylan/chitin deacetylase (PgdA/CDA1 family)
VTPGQYPSTPTRRRFLAVLGSIALGGLLRPMLRLRADGEPFRVPPTLMLHPREKDEEQLPRLLRWLTDNDYESILYADLAAALRGTAELPEKPVLLTIDDLGSHYIEPPLLRMADMVEQAGHKASFGVVTRDSPDRSPRVWDRLRELARRGFEMNTHTSRHVVLPDLESLDDHREEIIGSARMIQDGAGSRPSSLIAPYGAVYVRGRYRVFDQRIFDVAGEGGLSFVVGIPGGRWIDADARLPYYVGRVGVGVDHFQTRWWLEHFHE